MDYLSCVAKRTRRQTDFHIERLFRKTASGSSGGKPASGSFSGNTSSSTIKKKRRRFNEEDKPSGSGFVEKGKSKQRKTEGVVADEDDVVFLGEGVIKEQGKSVSLDSHKKRSSAGCGEDEGKRVLANDDDDEVKVIEINENDDGQCSAAEVLYCSENWLRKKVDDGIIHVGDADDFDGDRDGESDNFDDKGEDFDNAQTHWNSTDEMGVEVEPSPGAHKSSDFNEPIIIESDGDRVESSGTCSEFASDYLSLSTDSSSSEAEDSSDEDYRDDNTESSSSGDGSVSYCDDEEDNEEDDEDENETMFVMETHMRPVMKEHGRKVETESSGASRRNVNTNDDDIVQDFQGIERAAETVTSSSLDRNREVEVEEQVHTPSLARTKKYGEKSEKKVQDSCRDAQERKEHLEKGMKGGEFVMNERKEGRFGCNAERSGTQEHVEASNPNVPMSENHPELNPSDKLHKTIKPCNKGPEDGDKITGRSNNNDHDKVVKKEGKFRAPRNQARPKEFHIIELLRECIGRKHEDNKVDSYMFEEVLNDVHQEDTEGPAVEETLPLMFSFAKKPEAVEKSKSEKEMDMLWEEMQTSLHIEEFVSQVGIGKGGTNEGDQHGRSSVPLCRGQKHEFEYDEQIGIYCKFCSYVAVEVRDISEKMEKYPFEGSGRRTCSDDMDVPLFDGSRFNVSGGNSEAFHNLKESTVWDLIPNIKESMYPHQQEGFEFIWRNLAGSIDLHQLKNADPNSVGGCIISHAPGTGKTRLTIVFLQTYLALFPKCRPVIIAPAGILLTWEDEFKKWGTGIPFHNLNNLELSGKEDVAAMKKIDWHKRIKHNKNIMRRLKVLSWCQQKSILGISYNLYEKLSKDHSKNSLNEESEVMGRVLNDLPGLLVLDEGHTPRNKKSQIWKVLSETETAKRIILSGTPFQNNFLELYNTLYLVQPSFPDKMPLELKKFCQGRLVKEKERSKGVRWEQVTPGNSTDHSADKAIEELKSLMAPFVHVHKGSILQKSLPGLRDCVVVLNPGIKQKQLLETIQDSENTFKFEHKQTLVSIHPSLFLCCSLSEKEKSVINKSELQELKLNPDEGVKTKFLVEFVQLCQAVNEKVLVFSQYKDPLHLIKEQLHAIFHWSEGKEVLHMYGEIDKKQRQSMIHAFNDPKSQVKVLLASIKACSEGINLVGASRVVLLDVVWNPSVERQAVSRAYRLGQKRVVYCYHLITQGTTECEKYCKQAEKERISELVFSARNNENDKRKGSAAVQEDRVLDQMVKRDKLKDQFEKIIYQPKELGLLENFGSLIR